MSPKRKKRRSQRGQSSNQLAVALIQKQNVVFITGAGLSVASGVRTFRGSSGLWTEVIWKTATRSSFRKDPLEWYNAFWLPHFGGQHDLVSPNAGHEALEELTRLFPESCHVITQNVDGLQKGEVLEAHGRVGLYKCIPDEDSDTDSDSDEDDDREVHLGHRRKSRALRKMVALQEKSGGETLDTLPQGEKPVCRYQLLDSIRLDEIEPRHVREALTKGEATLLEPPLCPSCRRPVPPQALLFDEGYHSHDFYQFEKMEQLLGKAQVIVFVGTSFNVYITTVALDHARDHSIPVYNFNTQDVLEPSVRLNVENIVGKSDETLPRLVEQVKGLLETTDAL